jgi:hypothetical protein
MRETNSDTPVFVVHVNIVLQNNDVKVEPDSDSKMLRVCSVK